MIKKCPILTGKILVFSFDAKGAKAFNNGYRSLRGYSSDGRAPESHSGGQRFDSA